MDTIHFKLNKSNFIYNEVLNTFKYKLNPQSTLQYDRGNLGKSTYATFKNWTFSLTENNLIGKGSITKFLYGNNIKNISFEDLKLALCQLEAILSVDLKNAVITRIDIGFNLIMNKPVSNYLALLVCPNSFKDFNVANETREFRSKSFNLMFYDKIKESKRNCIPKSYHSVNLLRYELKCQKVFFKQLGLSNLKFGDLYDENIFVSLVNAWFTGFLRLSTMSSSSTKNEIDYTSVTRWRNSLAIFAIEKLGGIDYIDHIINAKSRSKVKHDLKKALKKLKISSFHFSNLIKEFHCKITHEYCHHLPDLFDYEDVA